MKMNTVEVRSLSRRAVLRTAALSALGGSFFTPSLVGAESGIVPTMVNAAANAKIEPHPIRRNITVLEGSGGNIAVLSGGDGKLLVDGGFSVSRPKLADALAALNSKPIKHLINTHWHTDHTDGNEWLHKAGASITAHENTRKHMAKATRVEGWDYTFPAATAGALPDKVFTSRYQMRLNDTELLLKYYSPAHTDSDISVYFVEADVLHTGDTWWSGVYPFIDYSTGGGISGTIRAAEANVRTATAETVVIPGHGPVGRKADLEEFRDMLVSIRDKVATLKKQGRSLHETIAAKPTAAFDGKWGRFLITPATFTELVYRGV
jgi:glyoxylase-like metal-dependent hydrolase (beta-lactamase superfamily II)